jgi:hypothetical protein
MPDFLPVRVQNQLRHCQSAVREKGNQISPEAAGLVAFSKERKEKKELFIRRDSEKKPLLCLFRNNRIWILFLFPPFFRLVKEHAKGISPFGVYYIYSVPKE